MIFKKISGIIHACVKLIREHNRSLEKIKCKREGYTEIC